MKLKALVFAGCFSLLGATFADTRHVHPGSTNPVNGASASPKKNLTADYCEVEIINASNDDVTVYARFDDNTNVNFNIYRNERPHSIDLYYYGYCHRSVYLDVVGFNGYHIFSGNVEAGYTLRIVPYNTNQLKAELQVKGH